ncbi:MAG: hypothetical protein ACREMF_09200 [Gemmatimonadales bacterium]
MQSTHALRVLPVVVLLAAPLAAQGRARVITDGEWFHQAPAGRRLAQLEAGAIVERGTASGEWTPVTLDGWIFAPSVGPTTREGFDLAVTRAPAENLRVAPDGEVIARLTVGFVLDKVGEQRRWVHVRRQGWVRDASLAAVTGAADTASAGSATSRRSPGTPGGRPGVSGAPQQPPDTSRAVDPSRVQSARPTTLFRVPDGPGDATLSTSAPLKVLGRTGEWTRVQLEGWVKTTDLQTAPSGVLLGVSAAELRAEPDRYAGQTLRWTLQVIAVRTADDLRPDIPTGATYVLARGPSPERGFVYVLVPTAQRAAVNALAPLATVQVTARVRTGRSRFIGNPVVELVSLEELP